MTDVMSSSAFYNNLIKNVFVQADAADMPAVHRVRNGLPTITQVIVASESDIPAECFNGKSLYLSLPKGRAVRRCPGSRGQLCCNYLTVNLYEGCSIGCTYCILKSYLNFSPIRICVDADPAIDSIREIAIANVDRTIRVGTGETGDSLLFDPLTRLSERFVHGLSDLDNVFFEMKTKTDFVDHLLDIPKKGNAVIGFSLSSEKSASLEEGSAAPVECRLKAARKAVDRGYHVAFHFDPIFNMNLWEERYAELAVEIGRFPEEKIAWISLGTFRYPAELKVNMEKRPYLFDEYVPSGDGKYRYIQKVRIGIYKKLLGFIRNYTTAPVYLCMESPAVWKRVFGYEPGKIPGLKSIFSPVQIHS
jgi:spore photoproduct lyase